MWNSKQQRAADVGEGGPLLRGRGRAEPILSLHLADGHCAQRLPQQRAADVGEGGPLLRGRGRAEPILSLHLADGVPLAGISVLSSLHQGLPPARRRGLEDADESSGAG